MIEGQERTPLTREFFDRPVLDVAPDLLGRTLARSTPEGPIELRLTEVEAYAGEIDPGSHAFRGRTARNGVMYGPPGHAYVYFTYGMWHCLNLVCGPEGMASGVLLRAGDIRTGAELTRKRRLSARNDRELAKVRPGSRRLWTSTARSTAPTPSPTRAASSRSCTAPRHRATRYATVRAPEWAVTEPPTRGVSGSTATPP